MHNPIPVINVKGLCNIEIDFDGVTITTKPSKNHIALFDLYKKFSFTEESPPVYSKKNKDSLAFLCVFNYTSLLRIENE